MQCLQQSENAAVAKKFTSIAGHFDSHADALKQYGAHGPIQHVQVYSRSHWTPSFGNYLLHIAAAASRGTAKNWGCKTCPLCLLF